MTTLNVAIGNQDLCAWQPVPGVTWVQTRVPDVAEKLAKRDDAKLVIKGVAGGYLRTFEFHHTLKWAKRLLRRYETPANDRIDRDIRP